MSTQARAASREVASYCTVAHQIGFFVLSSRRLFCSSFALSHCRSPRERGSRGQAEGKTVYGMLSLGGTASPIPRLYYLIAAIRDGGDVGAVVEGQPNQASRALVTTRARLALTGASPARRWWRSGGGADEVEQREPQHRLVHRVLRTRLGAETGAVKRRDAEFEADASRFKRKVRTVAAAPMSTLRHAREVDVRIYRPRCGGA